MVKSPPAIQEIWVQSLGREDALEKGMATHSSILAWRIPWTEEPGGLQSMGLQSQTRLSNYHIHFSLSLRLEGLEDQRGMVLKCPSADEWIQKVWYIHTMECMPQKKRNIAICRNMDRPRDYRTKWSKADRKRQMYNNPYMYNLKHDTNELIYETEIDLQTQRIDKWLPKEKTGDNWEFGINRYTLHKIDK